MSEDGFRSETAVAAAKATLDLAVANKERAAIELSKTKIVAPFEGIFDSREAEAGDFLRVGEACGTLIQQTPFLIVGSVAEKNVSKIKLGNRGVASIATGETVEGVVSFIAAAADPATRTFRVELETPNDDGAIRDGVTAEFRIFAEQKQAYHIPHSTLTLNEAEALSVQTVTDAGEVVHADVKLLGEDDHGVWINGLEGTPRVIVRGQEYVSDGQIVEYIDAAELNSRTAE